VQLLIDILLPLLTILVMLVVGLDLTPQDFVRVRQYPRTVMLAVIGQVLFLPVIGFAIAWLLQPTAITTAGLILVTAAPGGAMSNYYTYLARANTALSITLTAVSSVIATVKLPLVAAIGFSLLLDGSSRIDVPVAMMMRQLFLLLLLPIAVGMLIRHLVPHRVEAHTLGLRRFSIVALVMIIFFVILDQTEAFTSRVFELALTASLYTVVTMLIGWNVGTMLKAGSADKFALMTEFSVRNQAIVAVVGSTMFGNTELAVFAVAFFVIQVPFMITAIYMRSRILTSA
jgi:BASS family bile acid:Na+ symporter